MKLLVRILRPLVARYDRRRAARVSHLVEAPTVLRIAADIGPDLVLPGQRVAELEDRGGRVEVWEVDLLDGSEVRASRFLVVRPLPAGNADLLASETTIGEALRAGLLHVYAS